MTKLEEARAVELRAVRGPRRRKCATCHERACICLPDDPLMVVIKAVNSGLGPRHVREEGQRMLRAIVYEKDRLRADRWLIEELSERFTVPPPLTQPSREEE